VAPSRRKICVLTGNRAEYGLLRWTMQEILDDPDLTLQVIVTGSHLEPRFGSTIRHIEEDGFAVDARVPMLLNDSSDGGIARSMAAALSGTVEALGRLQPDTLVLLGDRFEVHAAATAAMVARVPIAHIHGGEATEGAIDEAIRHAVTKMAHLHFVSAEAHRRRVIQLGEAPERVFLVGAAGLDNIERLDLLGPRELEAALGFALGSFLLVTYHPATLAAGDSARGAAALLAALDRFPDRRVLITGTNADPGGAAIRSLIAAYAKERPARVLLSESLGQRLYLSALKAAAAVVGNSSSGIIEAPSLGIPTVNLGDRQRGRLRAASVIDCGETEGAIAAAIGQALDPGFRAGLDPASTPYGRPGAAKRIRDVLRTYPLDGILMKSFYDLPIG
jgi:UDP-hydrolysing UDP-N-acetyl-D-glucosamine 2-epimerase